MISVESWHIADADMHACTVFCRASWISILYHPVTAFTFTIVQYNPLTRLIKGDQRKEISRMRTRGDDD